MEKVLFLTTAGCHLCEVVEAWLAAMVLDGPLELDVIDIADSDELVDRYGTRIPVLCRETVASSDDAPHAATSWHDELGWPFTEEELYQYLAAHG